ncbi:MAG: hypothetical protein RR459_03270 [Christensenellaceae bacterium]
MSRNADVIYKAIEKRYETVLPIVLNEVAEIVSNHIEEMSTTESADGLPVWSGNLHDSTGIGLYYNGSLVAYKPSRLAIRKQHIEEYSYFGYEELDKVMNDTNNYNNGIWFVLFSASPIAFMIDTEGSPYGRGVGYFSDELVPYTMAVLEEKLKEHGL